MQSLSTDIIWVVDNVQHSGNFCFSITDITMPLRYKGHCHAENGLPHKQYLLHSGPVAGNWPVMNMVMGIVELCSNKWSIVFTCAPLSCFWWSGWKKCKLFMEISSHQIPSQPVKLHKAPFASQTLCWSNYLQIITFMDCDKLRVLHNSVTQPRICSAACLPNSVIIQTHLIQFPPIGLLLFSSTTIWMHSWEFTVSK